MPQFNFRTTRNYSLTEDGVTKIIPYVMYLSWNKESPNELTLDDVTTENEDGSVMWVPDDVIEAERVDIESILIPLINKLSVTMKDNGVDCDLLTD